VKHWQAASLALFHRFLGVVVMRVFRVLTVTSLLVSSSIIAPVVSFGSQPKPVSPKVVRVSMPTPQAVTATKGRSNTPEVTSTLRRSVGEDVDVVGVTFSDASAAKAATVSVRTKADGKWGAWSPVGLSDSAPDPGTREAKGARIGTEPVGVEGADDVELRVDAPSADDVRAAQAMFVDGGESRADSLSTPAASASAAAATKPTILTRAQWGADESLRTCQPDYVAKISGAIVHHTVNTNGYASGDVPGLLRGIYAYHVQGQGWCDIGYNFIVDRFGRIWEGRYGGDYRNVIGAQTQGFNAQTVGVASLGNHQSTEGGSGPSSATVTAIGKVIGWKAWLNGFNPTSSVTYTSAGNPKYAAGTKLTRMAVSGHRDFYSTACPGDLLYSKLATIRTTASATYATGTSAQGSLAATVKETYGRPAGTTVSLSGRGYGHGRGMSQYGAYGAALKGLTWQSILAFYYPGTSLVSTVGNPTMRVRLTDVGTASTTVVYQDGLTITDGTKTASLFGKNADGTVRQRWRVVPDGAGLTLQWLEKGIWKSTASWKATTKPLTFANSKLNKIRVVMPAGTQRDYRQLVRANRNGTAMMTVNLVTMQYYLQSVVPSEMPASWSQQALAAQAVAARSYALRQRANQPSGSLFDTCDTQACQVYSGLAGYLADGTLVPHENAASTQAVANTNGRAVYYNGAPALTEFSSSNGGYTVASSLPYQVSKSDPYDNVPVGSSARWTASLSLATIEKTYPSIGTLRAIRIESRNGISVWDGRIQSLTLVGSKASVTVTGDAFRVALRLRSTWWTVTSAPAVAAPAVPRDLNGDGLADLLGIDSQARLQLLAGNGAQGFTAQVMAQDWARLGLVANIGPWDQDNRADVVERDGGTLYYHPGNGRGGFYPRVPISSGWESINLMVGAGDFDGDGHNDFLIRNGANGQFKLYRGNGTGGVINTVLVGSGWSQFRLVVAPGDVTGDNKPDVLAVRSSDNAMFLYAGTGTGTVLAARQVTGSWAGYTSLMGPGDVTGDGRNDLVGRRSSDGALVVLAGNSMGAFTLSKVVGTTWATYPTWTP
jgi:SpoIID/LytB domain protein